MPSSSCRGVLHSLFSYVSRAQAHLCAIPGKGEGGRRAEEAAWFMKISWNLALECGEDYDKMADFFLTCHKVT